MIIASTNASQDNFMVRSKDKRHAIDDAWIVHGCKNSTKQNITSR